MKARFFTLQELVPPDLYRQHGDRCWLFLDPDILRGADWLREIFGPITINTWAWEGSYKESGLREFNTRTGAAMSMHKYGRALDLKPVRASVQEVHKHILDNEEEAYFNGIRRIENLELTPTWIHIDSANTDTVDMVTVIY